jgi:peptidoglycan biosynthesis protein MviN/MurJ (putative lipid II flippase)
MVKILFTLIIGIIIILTLIIFKKFIVRKINEYIDNKFEEEFYNRTNWFIRLFISKKKKYHEETDDYREIVNKVNKIANIIITVLIIILAGILVYYVYEAKPLTAQI